MKLKNNTKLLLISILLLFGCSSNIETKGYQFDKESLDKIIPQKSNYEEVLSLMGSPTVAAIYGEPKFFYIQQLYKSKPMTNPYVIDQKIIEISFRQDRLVNSIKEYKMSNMQELEFKNKTTYLPGNQIGVLEQFLGNIGRYNNTSNISKPGS